MSIAWMNDCSVSLMVPNITEVVLSAVIPSSKNPNTTVFLFKHPEDVAQNKEEYEQVGFVYTSNARLSPNEIRTDDGGTEKRAVNPGAIQLLSLLSALRADNPADYLKMTRDDLVNECQLLVGLAVKCPMTGRVKGNDGNTYINFKFGDIDFTDPDTFRDSLNDFAEAFSPSDLDLNINTESRYKRLQRPDNAVVPAGAEDGDEILG